MIKTVVFDIGNVVWRYRPLHNRVFRQWAKLMGFTLHQFRLNLYEKDGLYRRFEVDSLNLSDWLEFVTPNLDTQKLLDIFDQTFSDSSEFTKYFNHPVIELISTLRQEKFSVGCLSNTENFMYPYYQKYILDYFDYHILSWQVKSRKPDPKIYNEIYKHGKFLPSEILFIDDIPLNVAAAKKMGINAILYRNITQLKRDLKKYIP